MKFRQQLLLSSILVTLLLCISITITGIFVSKRNLDTDKEFTDKILTHYTNKASKLSKDILTSYTKKYLETKTNNLKYKILPIVNNLLSHNKSIEGNKELHQIFNTPLMVNNKYVGYFALIKGNSKVFYAPSGIIDKVNNKAIYKQYPKILNLKNTALKDGYSSGYFKFYNRSGEKIVNKYAVFIKIGVSDYCIAGLINVDGYHNAAEKNINILKREVLELEQNKLKEYYEYSLFNRPFIFTLSIIVIMFIFILVIFYIVGSITKPLNILTRKIKGFNPKKPEFNIELPKGSSKEIMDLANAFSKQEHDLVTYMHNFKVELENRHILEHELQVARKIQSSVLPRNSSEFSPPEFSLASKLISADSVAGDFYDYFFIDDNKLAILVADVSGKGIPAAFFMQRATTILHSFSINDKGQNPNKVLEKANDVLSQNNEACMFVTVFLAFYEINTGIMTYANAGHLKPFKVANGKITSFGNLNDIALGVMPNIKYKINAADVNQNETVVFYTNGIIDAISMDDEEYGKARFKKILADNENLPVYELCGEVISDIHGFYAGQQQDDITLLLFRRNQTAENQ